MTRNQLQYQTNVETQRHDLVTEQETHDYNVGVLFEQNRHNLETERSERERNAINKMHYERIDLENARHNVATEHIQSATLAESGRHNRAAEYLQGDSTMASMIQARASERRAMNESMLVDYRQKNLESQTNLNVVNQKANALNSIGSILGGAGRFGASIVSMFK